MRKKRTKVLTDKQFLALFISSAAVIAFLLIATFFPLKSTLFSQLFFKQLSHASSKLFIGYNITGITDYGYPDLFPYSRSSDATTDLNDIQGLGNNVVRVFVGNDKIATSEASRRLDSLLTNAASHNVSVIVSFIDEYNSGFNPAGTDQYYTVPYNSQFLLNPTFFASGYKNEYKSFVQQLVTANKGHSNVYAWEIGNELKDDANTQDFINFMQDMSTTIKNIDPSHPVATGMLDAAHAGLTPTSLYSVLPNVDIVTVHMYNGDQSGATDVDWAVAKGKQALVEEFGISGTGDRSSAVQTQLDFWQSHGVSGVLQWGFLGKNLSDNGNGDSNYGIDTVWHTDYNQLASLYGSYGTLVCNPSNVAMTSTPAPALVNNPITFTVSGSEGSTFVNDTWSGGVDCSGGFWGSKTCNATTAGSYTWTHNWKNCASGDCTITSTQCSKTYNYSVVTPTPTPKPTRTPRPTHHNGK